MEKIVQVIPARKAGAGDGEQGAAGEREYRVGFLDGSEVRVRVEPAVQGMPRGDGTIMMELR